jgi:hypothetical protein
MAVSCGKDMPWQAMHEEVIFPATVSNNVHEEWWQCGYELQAMHASLFDKLHTCAVINTQSTKHGTHRPARK